MQNHVWLEKRASSSPGLLSPSEEQHKIRDLLGDRFAHSGKLFHPDHTFFEVSTEEQLQASARRLFLWLGVKPGHLEIKYGDIDLPGIYTEDPGMKRLIINKKLRTYPFQCAAILTHLVLHAVIGGRRRFILEDPVENEWFINQSVIESGLALTVINGLSPVYPWHRITVTKDIDPRGYFPRFEQFIQGFAAYISNYRIHHEEYGQHLAPWIQGRLPEALKTRVTVRNALPVYIRGTIAKQKQIISKVALGFLLLCILAGAIIYAFSSGSSGPTADQQVMAQKISELRKDYDSCIASLQDKRRKLDHNDIFQQSIIDNEANRCTSLRSEYNSLADSYNKSLNN